MIRIVLIVIRLIWLVPYWMGYKFRIYRDTEKYPVEERYAFVRKFASTLLRKGRVEVESFGTENLPKENGYFMAPNHQGLADPLILAQTHERPVRAIVKKELTKVPIINSVIEVLKFWPMDRDDVRGSVKIIRAATNAVKAGENVFVYPEGTRSRQGNQILEFKGGTFKIPVQAKCPIVPVAVMNSYQAFDRNSLRKIYVKIAYLDPMPYEEYQDMSTNEIAKEVHDRIESWLQEHQD